MCLQANEKAAPYKNKVIRNWNEICTIYSKYHVTGLGAWTCAESTDPEVIQPAVEANDTSPEAVGPSLKRPRTGEAIMCMLGSLKTSFDDAMKSTEPLQQPQVTPPSVMLATIEAVPDMSRTEQLRAYAKLTVSERLFHSLLELPLDARKEWLLMLP
jgi:hypothetical protein